MDRTWLKNNSFLDREIISNFFKELQNPLLDAPAFFSDLAPESRKYFWEEFELYAQVKPNTETDSIQEEINSKLTEYPKLPADLKKTSAEILYKLESLYKQEREDYYFSRFHSEVCWILGQILTSFPDFIDEADWDYDGLLPNELTKHFRDMPIPPEDNKYKGLEDAYNVVEFILKLLGDIHIQDFFTEHSCELFWNLIEGILSEKDI